jgi:hypothetical protein
MPAVLLCVVLLVVLPITYFGWVIVSLCFLSYNTGKKALILDEKKTDKKTEGADLYDVYGIKYDDPKYDQFHIVFDQQILGLPFTKKKVEARVGCGPVAWGMLFNLYGKMGLIPKFKSMFPDNLDGAMAEIIKLGNLLETINGGPKSPKYGVSGGFTWPHKMPRAQSYLKGTGYHIVMYYNQFGLNVPGFINPPPKGKTFWQIAVQKTKENIPVLIGYRCGGILHYAIAHAYRNNEGYDEIYTNNGHNLVDHDNTWIRDPALPEEKKNAPFYMVGYIEKDVH